MYSRSQASVKSSELMKDHFLIGSRICEFFVSSMRLDHLERAVLGSMICLDRIDNELEVKRRAFHGLRDPAFLAYFCVECSLLPKFLPAQGSTAATLRNSISQRVFDQLALHSASICCNLHSIRTQ